MKRPITSAASTASPAPSVAVTMPPKMPPRMMTGSTSAQAASFVAAHRRESENPASRGRS